MASTESEDWATEEDADLEREGEATTSSHPALNDQNDEYGDEGEEDGSAVDLVSSQEEDASTSAATAVASGNDDFEFLQRVISGEEDGYEAAGEEEEEQEPLDLDEEEDEEEEGAEDMGELDSQEGTVSVSEVESDAEQVTERDDEEADEIAAEQRVETTTFPTPSAPEQDEGKREMEGQVAMEREDEIENYQNTVKELTAALLERDEKIEYYDQETKTLLVKFQEMERTQRLEEKYETLKKVTEDCKTEFAALLEEEREARASVETDLQLTKKQLNSTLEELKEREDLISELRQPPPDVPGADRQELLRLLDRRQHEISQLSEEWRRLASKLETTSAAKSEIQVKMEEKATQESSLKLREQLLSHEKELVHSQNEWLTRELEDKSEQLLRVKREKATVLADLEAKLAAREREVAHTTRELEAVSVSKKELDGKAEGYLKKLRDSREEQASVEEQLRKELTSQSRLAGLYQVASQEAQTKVGELLVGADSMQRLLEEVSSEKERLELQLNEATISHSTEVEELTSKVVALETELSRANDLLATAKGRTLPLSDSDILSFSPSLTRASSMLKSGMTLTQIYSQYVEVSECYEKEKQEREQVSNYLQQVLEELDEKTPALQQLRRDYDTSVRNCDQLTSQLNSIVEECETLRMESEEAVRQSRVTERENRRLKTLTGDLGRQVQILLKECEEARGGVVSSSHDQSHDISSHDISSSSQVISTHLVTFRSIEELQQQNEKLLAVVRELSDAQEGREKETVDIHTKELQVQLQTALQEVGDLRNARERQKEMVTAVVKQRDMYRTLLAQSTPLPGEQTSPRSKSVSGISPRREGVEPVAMVATPTSQIDLETSQALKELKEQFTTYRKEKGENDVMIGQQLETLRQEASALRMNNVKITAKINGEVIAGYSSEKASKVMKKAASNNISLALRDRPFERTITMQKDSTNHVGFSYNNGEIKAIVKDSSAARNGLLIDHYLCEVNGQNMIGVKDKDIAKIFDESPRTITITIMPKFIYDHLMKNMGKSLRKSMDHSIPDV